MDGTGVKNGWFPTVSCNKGSKGRSDMSPNQDNFSITYEKSGWQIATVLDGHGKHGHFVATRAVQTIPYYLLNSQHWPTDIGAAMTEAFKLVEKDLVKESLINGTDIQSSGSTVVVAAWKGSKLWTAHCGDSRIVVGYTNHPTQQLAFQTGDHKPETPEEKRRIEKMGGEVR